MADRSNNTIEIWDLSHTPHIDRVLLSTDHSVESLVWYNGRLFSSGLNGMINEHNLLTLLPKYNVPVTSGPCWCMALNNKDGMIAAGTEDGYINLFQVMDDSLLYEKILDKQEGRIMCLAWDATGERIVTGSEDAVRIWNVKTGHAIHKMTTGRAMTNRPTIVWCVTVTDDFTIITGDSRGKLSMWDGSTGTNIASHQSHKADVLSVCLDDQQTTVYAAGVDPLIATFEKIQMKDGVKWVRSIQRRIHDHDVRALAYCHGRLFSGGVDGYLALSSYPPKVHLRYPPLLQSPCVYLAPEARCLLLRYTTYLELWRLGCTQVSQPANTQHSLPLAQDAVKLVQLLSKDSQHIRCAAVSSDAKWIAYSTDTLFRLYSLDLDTEPKEPRLSRVSGLSAECNAVHCAQFSPDCGWLVCATNHNNLLVFELSLDAGPTLTHTFAPLTDNLMSDVVHLICISVDNQYIIAADRRANIVVWSNGKHYCTLPRYHCAPTAMAIQPITNHLVVVYCDHKIVEFSLERKKYTKFSRGLSDNHPKQWLGRSFTVSNVVFDPANKDIILLHDDSTICVIDKCKTLPSTEAKIPRLELSHSNGLDPGDNSNQYPPSNTPQHAFHVIKKYKHLVYFGCLGEGEMVAVEINPLSLMEKLPAPLKQKHFGAM
ncbi:U3 small nucleolar RNA-associated protein 4 homolog isoform X2 [Macrosteles quadrilineatus]|uniref:U3 small nucleolar RNA-associated protein 4 homolog isoform X2 n=1 Tax=Macrosteles quadrilineatus TaxID=74068 RepID=UPI0023E11EBF|nr:U3 small nucleolar RNA-associated protein 4 homolog isoform X2 [Macrosteles quadrilineatus]